MPEKTTYRCRDCGETYDNLSDTRSKTNGAYGETVAYLCTSRDPGLLPTRCNGTVHSRQRPPVV